jgi:hypothetical protein
MRKRGLKLTEIGHCINPNCNKPLFAELVIFPDDELCLECNPPREGLPTAFRLLGESGELSQWSYNPEF